MILGKRAVGCVRWSCSRFSFQRDVQNLVVRVAQNRESFGVGGSTFELDLDYVFAEFEVEDRHPSGDVAYKNIIDENSCGVSVQRLWSNDVNLLVPQVRLGNDWAKIGAPAQNREAGYENRVRYFQMQASNH